MQGSGNFVLSGGEVLSVVLSLFCLRPYIDGITLPSSPAGSHASEGAPAGCLELPESKVVFPSVGATVVPDSCEETIVTLATPLSPFLWTS